VLVIVSRHVHGWMLLVLAGILDWGKPLPCSCMVGMFDCDAGSVCWMRLLAAVWHVGGGYLQQCGMLGETAGSSRGMLDEAAGSSVVC
jgi:hypothetical protein